MDLALTIIPLVLLMFFFVCGMKGKNKNETFLSYSYTNAIKAFACVIIIYVHIPAEHTNFIQDMIGSFAYVGVFAFFMISAYGCRYKISDDPSYIQGFLKKRIVSLFVPAIIINFSFFILKKLSLNIFVWRDLYAFNQYIYAIIIAYFIFWLVWRIDRIPVRYKDFLVCTITVGVSLLTYFTPIKLFFIWPTESTGFVFGIIVYCLRKQLLDMLNHKRVTKIVVLTVGALVLGIAYLKFKQVYFWGGFVIRICLASVLMVLFFAISLEMDFKNRLLQVLGNCSYAVYLGHLAVISWLSLVCPGLSSGKFIASVIIITIFIAIPITKISNYTIQRIIDRR